MDQCNGVSLETEASELETPFEWFAVSVNPPQVIFLQFTVLFIFESKYPYLP